MGQQENGDDRLDNEYDGGDRFREVGVVHTGGVGEFLDTTEAELRESGEEGWWERGLRKNWIWQTVFLNHLFPSSTEPRRILHGLQLEQCRKRLIHR